MPIDYQINTREEAIEPENRQGRYGRWVLTKKDKGLELSWMLIKEFPNCLTPIELTNLCDYELGFAKWYTRA